MLKGYAIALIVESILELLLLVGMIVMAVILVNAPLHKRFSGGDLYTGEVVAFSLAVLYLIGRMC